jgi:hypothetical protein
VHTKFAARWWAIGNFPTALVARSTCESVWERLDKLKNAANLVEEAASEIFSQICEVVGTSCNAQFPEASISNQEA